MQTTLKERMGVIQGLGNLGIEFDDAHKLRRIAMTLRRWFELECGDSNNYASSCITRGRKEYRHGQHPGGHGRHSVFIYDDNGKPYLETVPHVGNDRFYSPIPDREKGARKRLAKIMSKYPATTYYIQTDPRGASLYIIRKSDVIDAEIEQVYTRGIAVY